MDCYYKDATVKILNNVVRSWLELYDKAFYQQHALSAIEKRITIYLDVICTVLEHYPDAGYMLVPVVLYADKYVRTQGIHHTQVFYLLLASTICTLKYWDDSAQSVNKSISLAFNYPLNAINDVEKSFLGGLKWDLSLSWEDIETFFSRDYSTALCAASLKNEEREE